MSASVLGDFEDRLSEGLETLAGRAVVPEIEAGDLIGRAPDEIVLLGTVDSVSIRSRRWLSIAAALVLIVGIGTLTRLASGSDVAGPPAAEVNWLVLPGEVVLLDDPLVVAAAPGAELRFDTTALGEEVVFEPADAVDAREVALFAELGGRGLLRKIVVLGRHRGDLYYVVISDNGDIRERALFGGSGGSGSGGYVEFESLELIEFPDHRELTVPANIAGYGVGPGGGQVVWDQLPSDVAVVAYEDQDSRLWIRPAAGAAIVPAMLTPGERFELTAYSADGEWLGMAAGTVEFGDEALSTPTRSTSSRTPRTPRRGREALRGLTEG